MSAGLAQKVGRVACGARHGRPPVAQADARRIAACIAADGALAIVSGLRGMRRRGLWQPPIFEGAVKLALAGVVLIWPAMAAVAFVRLTSAWAVITGALLLAAARRLSLSHGRWLLALAGMVSGVWSALAATVGPTSESAPESMGWWLVGYALPFAATLLILAGLLQRRHEQSRRLLRETHRRAGYCVSVQLAAPRS
jgi:uncharacterized membrane protein HdeD (DUF308 family)